MAQVQFRQEERPIKLVNRALIQNRVAEVQRQQALADYKEKLKIRQQIEGPKTYRPFKIGPQDLKVLKTWAGDRAKEVFPDKSEVAQREGMIERQMRPYKQRYVQQFTGQPYKPATSQFKGQPKFTGATFKGRF